MCMFSDGIYGVYIVSKSIFPDGKIRTFKRVLNNVDYYDLIWKPEKMFNGYY